MRAPFVKGPRVTTHLVTPFAPKGARHSSHGETVAGLDRLLKDRSATGRAAAARRAVLDQPVQTGTLGFRKMKGVVGRKLSKI